MSNCIDCHHCLPDFFFDGQPPTQGTCKDPLSDSYNKSRSARYSCSGYQKRETPNPAIKSMNEQYRNMYISWMRRRGDGVTFETNKVEIPRGIRSAKFEKSVREIAEENNLVTEFELRKILNIGKWSLIGIIATSKVSHHKIKNARGKYYTPEDVQKIKRAMSSYLNGRKWAQARHEKMMNQAV